MVLLRFFHEALHIAPHVLHHRRIIAQQADRCQGSRGQRRRDAHGEDKSGQLIAQIVDQVLGSRQISAAGAKALGQRAHLDVDVLGIQVVILIHTAAGLADHAGGMGFIHHQEAAEFLLDLHEFRNRRHVAVHGIDALDRNQHLGKLIPAGGQDPA